jgi:hypothetical protein
MKKNWLNYIAIIIAIISLGFSLFKVVPNSTFNNDTFIGVIAAFIGISVTLLIGYQIFNVVEIRDKINKLDALESKLQELNQKENYNYNVSQGNMLLANSISVLYFVKTKDSIAGLDNEPFLNEDKDNQLSGAIASLFASIYYFLQSDMSKIDNALANIEIGIGLNPIIKNNEKFSIENFNKAMKQLPNYNIYCLKIEEVHSKIQSLQQQ